ncbi:Rossmann-like domain-containing protein [Methanothermobacter wolfeii]|uniref:Rossmann-like domain-containing protein n=1 Tax=Methanothermobacter wolfeii TaxID=145261 RepID=UPI0024B3C0D1|nr:DUF364 domain-containing protein [Methanothermobacter wolfeii]MDI6703007.1 DUF364 domain-containing protein [Methanothermobacter wolfeii]
MDDMHVDIRAKNPSLDSSRIKDYPLLQGKEVMLRATLEDGTVGECFTDNPLPFSGSLKELLLEREGEIPCLIATLNAVMRKRGFIDKTSHCNGRTPEKCAELLLDYIEVLGYDKIGLIGFQPAFVCKLQETFKNLMVSDLSTENIGKKDCVEILNGNEYNKKIIQSSDVILVTGSTIANGTFEDILELAIKFNKRVIFYGTTIAGVSALLGVERFCPMSE